MEFGSVRPGRLPPRVMELVNADEVECQAEVPAADVERFGASLSSEQRAVVTDFNTDNVKFTAWPELVPLFPNLINISASGCELVEFPLALCALPNLRTLSLPFKDFVAIPSEVSRLQQLERLFLNGCTRLQRLPSSISSLTGLTKLDLEGCHQLPTECNVYFHGRVDAVQGRLSR